MLPAGGTEREGPVAPLMLRLRAAMRRPAAAAAAAGGAAASAATGASCEAGAGSSPGCTEDPATFVPTGLGSVPFWLTSKRWPASASPQTRQTAEALPAAIDVVVIGAGLSGAGAAYSLAQRGVPTLLLDARGVSGGASGRNGGFLGGATWLQMPVMLLKMPFQHAVQTVGLKSANLKFIREYVSKHQVDCDLDYGVDGCSYYATEQEFKDAIGWWSKIPRALLTPFGIHIYEGVEEMGTHINLKADAKAGPSNAWGCIRLKKDYDTICAARFVIAVVDQCIAMGTTVFTNTAVERVERVLDKPSGPGGDGGHIVHTSKGAVRCKKVIFATNAYTGKLCPVLADKIRPVRNHVLVTTPAPSLLKDGSRCGSGCNSGFNYWIQREDGRIVLGGFRDKEGSGDKGVDVVDDEGEDLTARAAIRSFLWETFDMGDASVEQEWTGILAWSCDDAPWVGAVPGQENAYVCAGFCGSGLSRAFMCGLSVGDMAAGEVPRQVVDKYVPDLSRGWSADIRAGHAVASGTTRADRVYKDEKEKQRDQGDEARSVAGAREET